MMLVSIIPQAAFIGGYTPHPVEAPAAAAAAFPGTPRTPGGGEDPRVALNRKHQEFLLKKEKEEQVRGWLCAGILVRRVRNRNRSVIGSGARPVGISSHPRRRCATGEGRRRLLVLLPLELTI